MFRKFPTRLYVVVLCVAMCISASLANSIPTNKRHRQAPGAALFAGNTIYYTEGAYGGGGSEQLRSMNGDGSNDGLFANIPSAIGFAIPNFGRPNEWLFSYATNDSSTGTGLYRTTGTLPTNQEQLALCTVVVAPHYAQISCIQGSINGNSVFYSAVVVAGDGTRSNKIFRAPLNPVSGSPVTLDDTDEGGIFFVNEQGTRVAYTKSNSTVTDFLPSVYTMKVDGTDQQRLTAATAAVSYFDPQFSKSGNKLVFNGQDQSSGADEIYIINADGSGLTRVTNYPETHQYYATFSPDDTKIAYTRYNQNTRTGSVYLLATGGVSTLIHTAANGLENGILYWNPTRTLVSGLTVAPSTVAGGSNAVGTVTLNAAPTGATTVNLSSTDASVTVPSSISIAAGTSSKTFTVTTAAVTATKIVTITATLASGFTKTTTLTVSPPGVDNVKVSPDRVIAGSTTTVTGTVTLISPAPAGGATVLLGSNKSSVSVPHNVKVSAGSSSATFRVTYSNITSDLTATITATYVNVSKTATLTVVVPKVADLQVYVGQGGSTDVNAYIRITDPAPDAGVKVSLTSSNSNALSVPANATVAKGQTTVTVPLTVKYVGVDTTVTIRASAGGVAKTATYVLHTSKLDRLVLSTNQVSTASSNFKATVFLTGPAGPSGMSFPFSSSNPSVVRAPSTIRVQSGKISVDIPLTAAQVTANTSVNLVVGTGDAGRTATITVIASTLKSLTIAPTSVNGGNVATGTVTLNANASGTGQVINLSVAPIGSATVPASVTVPAGSKTAQFQISTAIPTADKTATITATNLGITKTATLSIKKPAPGTIDHITIEPTVTIGGNGTVMIFISLTGPAPAGGLVVSLTSSLPTVAKVSASVTIPAGSSSGSTTVTTFAVSSPKTVTIGAKSGSVTKTGTLTVNPVG